jgi:polyphosphate kinase 2 (PPK2 family)
VTAVTGSLSHNPSRGDQGAPDIINELQISSRPLRTRSGDCALALSYEDFRNRARRSDYVVAIEDMLEETSTKFAPWYLIPANDKPFGRIAAFRVIADRLGKGVG